MSGGVTLSQKKQENNPSGADEFQYAQETKADAILFDEVCTQVFEKMRRAKGKDARLDLLAPILARVGKESAFPFLRLVLPQLDNDRGNYGLKNAKLAKLYANMYFRDRSSKSFQRLVHHTDPLKNPSPDDEWQIAGDFPLTLEYVLQNIPCVEKSTFTLKEVNDLLDELVRARDDKARERVLAKFRHEFSPMNQKWLVRIILRDLKIQLKKDSVLSRLHPDALDQYNKTTSLRKVCSIFVGRHSSMRSHSDVEVFTSFYPMLAKNFFYNTARIVPSFQGRPFCMDVKLDGERMLCHKEGDKIMWLTRNAKDYTERYGPVLSPCILRGVCAHKCILDGEVVTWDDTTGSMVPFGHNRTYAREEIEGQGTGTRWLFYVVFDIVYVKGSGEEGRAAIDGIIRDAARGSREPCVPGTPLKGGNITALPLDLRRRVLRAVVIEEKHRLEIVKSRDVEAGIESERQKQLSDFFDQHAIQLNEEGLVVKDLSGSYEMGERSRNSGLWVKMKPEYSDQTPEADLIVLAAGFAHGSMRSGLLSKFLLGVALTTTDGSPPREFYPMTRVASGFSMQQLEDLNERTRGKWTLFEDRPPPHLPDMTLKALRKGRDGIQVTRWIEPQDSFCLEVKCSEIVRSSDWPVIGYTMRFPRVIRIRFDKGAESCLDTTELAALLARPRPSVSLLGETAKGKRRRGGGSVARRGKVKNSRGQVSSLFAVGSEGGLSRGDGEHDVQDGGSVFVTQSGASLEICVLGTGFFNLPLRDGDNLDVWWDLGAGSKRESRSLTSGEEEIEELSKQEMDDLIKINGGIVVGNPGESTAFVVVGDKQSISVKNVIALGRYNVVGHRWALDCIEKGNYEFPSFEHLRAVSPQIREHLSGVYDDYGDSYLEPTDAAKLSKIMLNMDVAFEHSGEGVPTGGGTEEDRSLGPVWLRPLLEIDEQDAAAFMDTIDFIFADTSKCLIYCDMFQDLGPLDPAEAATIGGDMGETEARGRSEVLRSMLASTVAAVRLHGGDVACSLHAGVTHVILDPTDGSRHASIRSRIRELQRRPDAKFQAQLVTPAWVDQCIERGRLEPPGEEYRIPLLAESCAP